MLDTSCRVAFDDEHQLFRDSVRKLVARELVPHIEQFERDGIVSRALWRAFGAAGMLCPNVPEQHGGLGLDFRYNAVIGEEIAYVGSTASINLQNDVTAEYLVQYGNDEQKAHYLPGMISGDIIVAIAMTEPGAGSDLQGIRSHARRDGDHYVVNGSKIYITNGQLADLIILAVKTDPAAGAKGISLFLVDGDLPGVMRGRNLDKIGNWSADTSELFFEDLRLPASALLGEEGKGFTYLMSQLSQERLSICVSAMATAQRGFDEALAFATDRGMFGGTLLDFQNTRFTLADLKSQLQVGWAHLDWAILRHIKGRLTTAEASAAKLWHSEMQNRLLDVALQLHGGAGYMNDYLIARLWRDARVTRIFGGANEIMKEVVGRSLARPK